jgi:hypothetical protein
LAQTAAKEAMTSPTLIRQTEHRETAQVWFPDGRVFEGPIGAPLESFVQAAGTDPQAPTVAALVNMELRELTYRVDEDIEVTPVTMAHSDGQRIYCRSLVFLLVKAVQELFPQSRVYVDHSLTFGGYFCEALGRERFSPQDLAAIEARMREIVAADEPIRRERVPLSEAIALFRAPHNLPDQRVARLFPRVHGPVHGLSVHVCAAGLSTWLYSRLSAERLADAARSLC